MTFLGITLGLIAALSQAVSYIFSRRFVVASGQGAGELLTLSHIIMGLFSLALLPFVWVEPDAGWAGIILPVLGVAGFYLAGQAAFFTTLKTATASQVSPLLGLKVAFIAGFSYIIFGTELENARYVAVGLSVAAMFCQSGPKGGLGARAVIGTALTCVGYSLSDLSISRLIPAIAPDRNIKASAMAVVLTYVLCGVAMAFRFRPKKFSREAWKQAAAFSATWYAAMLFFFATIGLSGAVFAAILQSTRGIFSVALGIIIARLGWLHIEGKATTSERTRQIISALLMFAAICIYAKPDIISCIMNALSYDSS